MKIGVLSDTHLTSIGAGMELAEQLLSGPFAGIDVIIHAGDIVIPELESCFYPIPWFAVRGNMDAAQVVYPERRILEFASIRIGLIHGWGAPTGIEKRVMAEFQGEMLDVLIFGHSHQPVCRREGDLLLMNPGSPTDRRFAPGHTVGLLTIEQGLHGEIIHLDL